MNKVAFFEFVGFVLGTYFILEDKLKIGCRSSLDKMDNYFYGTVLGLLINDDRRSYIPFK